MSTYISDSLRAIVIRRAKNACEYCLIHQKNLFHKCHIDHIISVRHGGATSIDNLALACSLCNRNKAADVGTFLFEKNRFTRLYNPRKDSWKRHFYIENGLIQPHNSIGMATVKLLDFNEIERVIDRRYLLQVGQYFE